MGVPLRYVVIYRIRRVGRNGVRERVVTRDKRVVLDTVRNWLDQRFSVHDNLDVEIEKLRTSEPERWS